MTLVKRSTKGAPLTIAEHDGNLDHVLDRANHTGTQLAATISDLGALATKNTVATADVTDGAITSAKIADGTIATGDIADNAITAVKINQGAVTNARLATVAAPVFKGRVTAGTGTVEDLTPTQATSMLDAFTSAAKGLAPASGGGTSNFLRADGAWAVPAGAGGGPASTDGLPEGTTNLYFTEGRVRSALLTGLSVATNAAVAATDSILAALGKLQAQISGLGSLAGKSAIATADINDGAVTMQKLEPYSANGVAVRSAGTSGTPSVLAMAQNTVLLRSTGNVTASQISTGHMNDKIVTNAKMADMAQATVKMRKTAGIGVPEDGTIADLVGLMDTYFGSTDWRTSGSGSSITVGSGAPSTAPAAPGLFYFDTNLYDLYFSTGSATSADWRKAIDNNDGAAIAAKATPILADTVFQFDSANSDAPVISTWTQIIAALSLVTLDGSGRLVNPKSIYTSFDGGTISTGTFTPSAANGNMSHYVNNGAHTIGVPASPATHLVEIVNGPTAGAITTSAYTKVSGDPFTTTNGHKFQCSITKTDSTSHLIVRAMQ